MCRTIYCKNRAICMQCGMLSVYTCQPMYECVNKDNNLIPVGQGRNIPDCIHGIGFKEKAEIWYSEPTQWLNFNCDVCEELLEQCKYQVATEAEEASAAYAAEPAVPGPATFPISKTHDRRHALDIDNFDNFATTKHNPIYQLLEARFPEGTKSPEGDEVPEYRGFAQVVVSNLPLESEEVGRMFRELAELQNRDEYHEDQQTWNATAYIEFLKRNPDHDSNMRMYALREYYDGREVPDETGTKGGPRAKKPRVDLA